jgi:hypothetical protein
MALLDIIAAKGLAKSQELILEKKIAQDILENRSILF